MPPIFFVLIFAAAAAPQPAAPPPAQISAFAACRAISAAEARLSCYDTASARLEQAIASKELTILSRSDVREARRSLFGFFVPKLPFLSNADGDATVTQIVSKITSVRSSGYNKWQFRLEDGALWETTEPSAEGYGPDSGSTVTIKQGVLGNYFIAFAGMRTLRGRRIS